jgi:hypothetical protein
VRVLIDASLALSAERIKGDRSVINCVDGPGRETIAFIEAG